MATVNDTGIKIHRADDSERLAHAALEIFVQSAGGHRGEGAFFVAISGGHTPVRFFELLGLEEASLSLPWEKVQLFWVDERCVPPEAEASNYGLAAHTFLDKVGIPAENVHRMSGECADYQVAVSEYRNTLRRVFRLRPGETPQFDLIVLGMGEDGHIGSLYRIALRCSTLRTWWRLFIDGGGLQPDHTDAPGDARGGADYSGFGFEKAQILKEVLTNEPDPVKYPVHTL